MSSYKIKKTAGFTLVELLVAVALTAILMFSISFFFSNSFKQLFVTREDFSESMSQLKFASLFQKNALRAQKLAWAQGQNQAVVLKNDFQDMPLSFTYMGLQEDKIALKDFIYFSDREGTMTSSNFASLLDNPGGFTPYKNVYYVAAPLQNAVYECSQTCSKKLNLEGLKTPVDVATDGENLYLTDAGNGRILKVEKVGGANIVTVLAENLSFPTGLEYDSDGKGALFVADTGHHQVKKISLSDGMISIVVGKGDNSKCDQTAQFCSLLYPTGLSLGVEAGQKVLYIADTGRGRVLKLYNPPAISEFPLTITMPDQAQAIKEISFLFPPNTNLGVASLDEVFSTNDDLSPKGQLVLNPELPHHLIYQLWTTLFEDTVQTNACQPAPCLVTMNRLKVVNPDLFDTDQFNEIAFPEDPKNPFLIQKISGLELQLNQFFSQHLKAGVQAFLSTPIQAKSVLNFKFNNVETASVAGGFKPITLQLYDLTGKLVASQKNFFRFSDPELGTPEDLIAVEKEGLLYPTGVDGSSGQLQWNELNFPQSFQQFDYSSDFIVQNLLFTQKNAGKVLELNFETLVPALKEGDAPGIEPHHFTLSLNP